MFTFTRENDGIVYAIPVLFINETGSEQVFEHISIVSSFASETLTLAMSGSLRFVSESVEYVGPFSGADFLTEREGTLYITITEDLSPGIHQTFFINAIEFPGVCGFGVFGCIQGGRTCEFRCNTPIVLQVQALPENWNADVVEKAQPYVISTIIRP